MELRARLEYELLHDRLKSNTWDPASLQWLVPGATPQATPPASPQAAPQAAATTEATPAAPLSPALPELVATDTPAVSEEMQLRELRQRLIERGTVYCILYTSYRQRLIERGGPRGTGQSPSATS